MNLFRKFTNVIVEKTLVVQARGWLETKLGSFVAFRGYPVMMRQGAAVAMTTSATIASTAIIGGLITGNQGGAAAATYTLPTGAVFDAALKTHLGTNAAVNDSFDFSIINISAVAAEDITVATAAGWTLVGTMVVESNEATAQKGPSGRFRVRRTAPETFTLYRLA